MGLGFWLAMLAPAALWYGLGVALPWVASGRAWPMPRLSSWALQLAVAPALVALLLFGREAFLFALAAPVLGPAFFLQFLLHGSARAVLGQQAGSIALGWLAGTLTVAALAHLRRNWLRHAPSAFMLVSATFALGLAQASTGGRIAARADERGAACLSQQGLLASIRRFGPEFGQTHHAEALIDGTWHHWSYRVDDFVPTERGFVWPSPKQRACMQRDAWRRNGGRP